MQLARKLVHAFGSLLQGVEITKNVALVTICYWYLQTEDRKSVCELSLVQINYTQNNLISNNSHKIFVWQEDYSIAH